MAERKGKGRIPSPGAFCPRRHSRTYTQVENRPDGIRGASRARDRGGSPGKSRRVGARGVCETSPEGECVHKGVSCVCENRPWETATHPPIAEREGEAARGGRRHLMASVKRPQPRGPHGARTESEQREIRSEGGSRGVGGLFTRQRRPSSRPRAEIPPNAIFHARPARTAGHSPDGAEARAKREETPRAGESRAGGIGGREQRSNCRGTVERSRRNGGRTPSELREQAGNRRPRRKANRPRTGR